jgi:hypothetical protein
MAGGDSAAFDGLGVSRRQLFWLLGSHAGGQSRSARLPDAAPLFVDNAVAIRTSHDRANIVLSGGFYPVTAGKPRDYPSDFRVWLTNSPSAPRGKLISFGGLKNFILWPGQTATLFNGGSVGWIHDGQGRWNMKSEAKVYVDAANGSDVDNDGLAARGGAMATIVGAFRLATQNFMANGGAIDVVLADGRYETSVNFFGGQIGSYLFTVGGAPGHTANVVMTGTCAIKDFVAVGFHDMTFAPSAGAAIGVDQNGIGDVGSNVAFASAPGAVHLGASNGGVINVVDPYTIHGGSVVAHWYATTGGRVNLFTPTVNIAAPLACSQAFALASYNGLIKASGIKFEGAGTPGAPVGAILRSVAQVLRRADAVRTICPEASSGPQRLRPGTPERGRSLASAGVAALIVAATTTAAIVSPPANDRANRPLVATSCVLSYGRTM